MTWDYKFLICCVKQIQEDSQLTRKKTLLG